MKKQTIKALQKKNLVRFAHEEIAALYDANGKIEPKNWPDPVVRIPTWSAARKFKRGMTVTSPNDAVAYFAEKLGGLEKEAFVCLYLDHRNHAIYCEGQPGTVDHSAVYPREVLTTALMQNATGIIMAHNHPAGSLEPSEGDKQITKQVLTAARALGITVHDHIIITAEGHFSFRQAGQLV